MNETLTLVCYGIGIAASSFCAFKAHRVGKVIPDAVQLIEDLTADKVDSNEDVSTK